MENTRKAVETQGKAVETHGKAVKNTRTGQAVENAKDRTAPLPRGELPHYDPERVH